MLAQITRFASPVLNWTNLSDAGLKSHVIVPATKHHVLHHSLHMLAVKILIDWEIFDALPVGQNTFDAVQGGRDRS